MANTQHCKNLLNAMQQTLAKADYPSLLPMAEQYASSIQQLHSRSDRQIIQELLAMHEEFETSLRQTQQKIEAMYQQVTHHKIDHAYQQG